MSQTAEGPLEGLAEPRATLQLYPQNVRERSPSYRVPRTVYHGIAKKGVERIYAVAGLSLESRLRQRPLASLLRGLLCDVESIAPTIASGGTPYPSCPPGPSSADQRASAHTVALEDNPTAYGTAE